MQIDMPISIRGLTVGMGGADIMRGLDLDLAGASVCLFGKSGCGKSTLLNVLAGLVEPDAGSIDGRPCRDYSKGTRIAYLFQEDRLLPWVDALENVRAAAHTDAETARRWLLDMGLQPGDLSKLPGQLSGGMKRRVAIARALAYGGDLLLLDEPFRGLDEARRAELMGILKDMLAGRRMILVTHDMHEARSLCGQIIMLDGPPLKVVDINENKTTDP